MQELGAAVWRRRQWKRAYQGGSRGVGKKWLDSGYEGRNERISHWIVSAVERKPHQLEQGGYHILKRRKLDKHKKLWLVQVVIIIRNSNGGVEPNS